MQMELFSLGFITNTQGLQGWAKLTLNPIIKTFNPQALKLVFYKQKNNFLPLQIEECEVRKTNYLLKFKELNSIDEVLFLKSKEIFIANDQENICFTKQIPWTEYLVQLNQEVGHVVDWMNNGAQDLIKVQSKNHQFWVPMVDVYLKKVDYEKKVIYLINYEGLM
jgi:16S rRNA processing protein RimM